MTYFANNVNSNDVMLRSIDQSLQKFWEIEDYEHDEVIASKPQDTEALLTVKAVFLKPFFLRPKIAKNNDLQR